MNNSINFRAIDDPALIEVLGSPIRQEIVDMLAALGGEASAGDVAEHLGRHADGLYYHLKILCKAGLLAPVDAGADGRRFRLSGDARPLRLAYKTADEAQVQTLRTFIHGLLQVAEQDFDAALTMRDVITQGSDRELWAARNKAWLSADELVEVNELLERLCSLMSRPRTPERDRLLSCTFVLAPNRAVSKRRGTSESE
jgi:DNA-binding transcriptional ArsR family regulator